MLGALLAVAVVIGLAGCGSSASSTSSSSAARPTTSQGDHSSSATSAAHAQLVAKLDALCSKANAELSALYTHANVKSYPAAAKEAAAGLRIYRRYIPRFAALAPPPEDAAAFRQFVSTLHQQLQLSSRAPAAFAAEEQQAIQTLKAEIATNVQARRKAAAEIGAEQCGHASSSGGG